MRARVFDRSGPYSSTVSDIHEQQERLIRTVSALMSDDELGLDTSTEMDDGNRFITVV